MTAAARRFGYAAYCVLAAAALLLAGEGVARLAFDGLADPVFSDPALRSLERPFVAPHPRRGFALVPGFANRAYRIGADGFRGRELPASEVLARHFVILAVGDSATFGWQVSEGNTYPEQLETFARERGLRDALVVNAGVPSYTSSQVRIALEDVLRAGRPQPDLVLVNVLWNDLYASLLPRWDPALLVAQPPARWLAWLLTHSRGMRWLASGAGGEFAQDRFRAEAVALYAANLDAMVELARASASQIAFVVPAFCEARLEPPRAAAVRFTKPFFAALRLRFLAALHEIADRRGVTVLSHRLARDPVDSSWFRDAVHPTILGYRIMAEDLAGALAQNTTTSP